MSPCAKCCVLAWFRLLITTAGEGVSGRCPCSRRLQVWQKLAQGNTRASDDERNARSGEAVHAMELGPLEEELRQTPPRRERRLKACLSNGYRSRECLNEPQAPMVFSAVVPWPTPLRVLFDATKAPSALA